MKRNDAALIMTILALCASTAFATAPSAQASAKTADPKLSLATVNGEPVTAADLLKLFTERHSGHAAFLGGETEARSFLNIVVDEKLLTQEAYNLALDEEESVKTVVRDYEDNQISEALVRRELVDKARISEADLEAAIQNLGVVLQVRQVALATRREAEEVREAVLQGGDIEEIARNCSGARSRRNGGNIMVAWGQFAPEWENVVLALEPGEISPVIETLDGYEVVVCVNRVEIPLPELKDVRDKVEPTVQQRRTAAREKALTAELWSRHQAAFADIDLSPKGLYSAYNSDPGTVVATWTGGGKLALKDTFNLDELRQLLLLPPVRAKNEIEKRIRATVNLPLSILEARSRKYEDLPEITAKVSEYREYIMKNLLFRDHIFREVNVKDEDVQKYYEAHKSEFEEAPQYRLAQIMVASEQEAKDAAAKVLSGTDFGELASKISRDPVTASTGGDLGWVTRDRIPADFQELLTLKPGSMAKPVQAKNGAWHLVKVLEFKDKRLPALDEVRQKVREKAIEAARHEVRAEWVSKLRAASKIDVDAAAIKQFVLDHQSDADAPPPQHSMK